MTKFSQVEEPQRQYLINLYLEILRMKSQEEQDLNRLVIRGLLLANVAGLASVITFIGILIQTGKQYSVFENSLILFLTGAGCAALVQFVLMIVSSQGIGHYGSQLDNFIKGHIDLESMQGWGLSLQGRIIVMILLIASMCLFSVGVWAGFIGLTRL